jgi:hypothetical protein
MCTLGSRVEQCREGLRNRGVVSQGGVCECVLGKNRTDGAALKRVNKRGENGSELPLGQL